MKTMIAMVLVNTNGDGADSPSHDSYNGYDADADEADDAYMRMRLCMMLRD